MTCDVCGRENVRGVSSLAGTESVNTHTGERVTLDGKVCRVCLTRAGYVPATRAADGIATALASLLT